MRERFFVKVTPNGFQAFKIEEPGGSHAFASSIGVPQKVLKKALDDIYGEGPLTGEVVCIDASKLGTRYCNWLSGNKKYKWDDVSDSQHSLTSIRFSEEVLSIVKIPVTKTAPGMVDECMKMFKELTGMMPCIDLEHPHDWRDKDGDMEQQSQMLMKEIVRWFDIHAPFYFRFENNTSANRYWVNEYTEGKLKRYEAVRQENFGVLCYISDRQYIDLVRTIENYNIVIYP